MLTNIRLRTLKNTDAARLVLQIASDVDSQDCRQLWDLCTSAMVKSLPDIERQVLFENESLEKWFGFKIFKTIEWCIGNWSQGAISMVRKQQILIVSGDRNLNHHGQQISHIVRHELLHFYLRQVLPRRLHAHPMEEMIVQFNSKWELSEFELRRNQQTLSLATEAIHRQDWTNLKQLFDRI